MDCNLSRMDYSLSLPPSVNDETTGRQTTDVERHQTIRSKVQFRRFFDPLDPRAHAMPIVVLRKIVKSSFDVSGRRCVAAPVVLPRRLAVGRFWNVAAPLRPSLCCVDTSFDVSRTLLRCCTAALLHSCTAALLHCCERQHSPERQQTNDKQTNDSRQTTNEHRRERQRAQRAVLSLPP